MRRADRVKYGFLAILLTVAMAHHAKAEDKEKEPSAIVELGGAGEWNFRDGTGSLGPSIAVEVTPIPEWLELEAGVTSLFSNSHPEWSADFLLKKPFTLSKTVEFMIGAGPEWTYTTGGWKVAGEIALDFMIWPWPDRKFGWFVEPSYSYSFSNGHEQSIGVTLGLLIAIP